MMKGSVGERERVCVCSSSNSIHVRCFISANTSFFLVLLVCVCDRVYVCVCDIPSFPQTRAYIQYNWTS